MTVKNLKIERLSDKEHIIRRPGMYIGSIISTQKPNNRVWDTKAKKFITKDMNINDGFVKIVNEVIDNSIDIIHKAGGKTISINFGKDFIEVQDDGVGFPVSELKGHENPLVVALGNARAGSNFNDETNVGQIGMNGVGAFATNCFSTEFSAVSRNGQQEISAKWINTELVDFSLKSKKSKTGTTIWFKPNLKLFKLHSFGKDNIDEIYTRLVFVATMYKDLTIKFNGEKVDKIQTNGSVKLGENCVLWIEPGTIDDSIGSINGLGVHEGSHIKRFYDIITKQVNSKFEKIVTNALRVTVMMKGFINPKFDSQTKVRLVNPVKDIDNYLKDANLDNIKRLLRLPENVAALEAALAAKAGKDEQKAKKSLVKVKTDKYTPSVGKPKILVIVEGDSALGGLCNALGRQGIAYYKLKGKILNTYNETLTTAIKNTEVKDIIGLVQQYEFEKIVFGTDQDLDGFHIRGLLLCLFEKFLKEYKDRVYFLQTPIQGTMKDNKIVDWAYSLNNNLKGNIKYFKGLGSWSRDDLKKVIQTDTLDKMLEPIDYDYVDGIRVWFSKDASDERKQCIQTVDFDLNKV